MTKKQINVKIKRTFPKGEFFKKVEHLILYYIAVNIAAFVMYGADKYFAKKKMRRISEKSLILVAAMGGAFGAYAGMQIFRHKTKHTKFNVLVPVCMAAHAGAFLYLFEK